MYLGRSGGNAFCNWVAKNQFVIQIHNSLTTTTGVLEIFFGKKFADATGAVANGSYVGVRIEGRTLVSGYVCNNNTLNTVALTPATYSGTDGLAITIDCNNGNVRWLAGNYTGVSLVGETLLGPVANTSGVHSFELTNGANAAEYRKDFWVTATLG